MKEKTIDVAVAGHICIDITPQFGEMPSARAAEVFRPGCLIEVGPSTITGGGCVSNTGLALARLGLDVSLMGKCGDDHFGDMLLRILRDHAPGSEKGVHVVSGEITAYSIVIALPGTDRLFLEYPGANNGFGSEDIDLDVVARSKIFHLGYPPLLKRMYSAGGEELARVMADARRRGTVTSLDMSLPDPGSESGQVDWHRILSEVLPCTSLFLPSIEELMFMLRRDRFDELTKEAGGVIEGVDADDLASLSEECLNLGAEITVIKCGWLGAYIRSAESLPGLGTLVGSIQQWRGVELFEPTLRVDKVQNACGAGDCSIAGFLAALLNGMEPHRCMQALACLGAQNLSSTCSTDGIRPWGETLAALEAKPPRNSVPKRLAKLPVRKGG